MHSWVVEMQKLCDFPWLPSASTSTHSSQQVKRSLPNIFLNYSVANPGSSEARGRWRQSIMWSTPPSQPPDTHRTHENEKMGSEMGTLSTFAANPQWSFIF